MPPNHSRSKRSKRARIRRRTAGSSSKMYAAGARAILYLKGGRKEEGRRYKPVLELIVRLIPERVALKFSVSYGVSTWKKYIEVVQFSVKVSEIG